jgi:hypothetical protein
MRVVVLGLIEEREKISSGMGVMTKVDSLSPPRLLGCHFRKMHGFAPALCGIDVEHVFKSFSHSRGQLTIWLKS